MVNLARQHKYATHNVLISLFCLSNCIGVFVKYDNVISRTAKDASRGFFSTAKSAVQGFFGTGGDDLTSADERTLSFEVLIPPLDFTSKIPCREQAKNARQAASQLVSQRLREDGRNGLYSFEWEAPNFSVNNVS